MKKDKTKKGKSRKARATTPDVSVETPAALAAPAVVSKTPTGTPNIDFMGRERIAFTFSLILAIIGIIAAISIPLGKANLGTDFSGGVAVQFRFDKPVVIETVREVLIAGGIKDAELQEIGDSRKLMVKIKRSETDLRGLSSSIGKVFNSAMPDNPYVVDSTEEVGPTVGKRLQKDALFAIAVALFGILFYIGWRFEFRFGIAAVVATFHDVLAVLGILFIVNMEINLLIITALLTIAGYSINDSVVVFDRIRENLRKNAKTKETLTALINRSINEMLRRTVVTSGTTLLVLLSLIIFGGEVIHDFAITLFLGVLIGTYSSIFIASPMLLVWKGKGGKLIKDNE
ncbi:MAG: protein translocase subunit SecF [Thermodesulfobacteriota bacterium]